MIVHDTPIDRYSCRGINYFVKREDKSCTLPGPPSAKMRGLSLFLEKLKNNGITHVGYMDTAISMAGWGISYFAREYGIKAVIYYPKYKDGYRFNQSEYIPRWESFGAEVVPLERPQLWKINIAIARKDFLNRYPAGRWLPEGLKFDETLILVREEAKNMMLKIKPKTIICSVGSGVMLAGILQGISLSKMTVNKIVGVRVTTGINLEIKRAEILKIAKFQDSKINNIFTFLPQIRSICNEFIVVDDGYKYHEVPAIDCPFPCNDYYDLKAYDYMIRNIKKFEQPILYWNVGG